jgi:choline dehydrogenase-like flavoprotein
VPIAKRDLEIFTVHLMSTCRMSADPRRSVLDEWGHFRGFSGLMVSDASMLPGPIGVNPMETICALATRNAMHALEQPI